MKNIFNSLVILFLSAIIFIGCESNSVTPDETFSQIGSLEKIGGDLLVPTNYATIQEAIDVAVDGSLIRVLEGTYKEQIEIRNLNGLQIEGIDAVITIPEGGMVGQLVKIVNCTDIHIKGFTIDGQNGNGVAYGARNSGGDTDTRFNGLFVINSSGHITDNVIKDVGWGNGVQQGLGIYVLVDDNVPQEVNISNNIITNFQKNGLTIVGPLKAKIHNNIIEGWGDTDVIAQNCIQLSGDPSMTASVTNNTISKSNYTLSGWASTGILLYGNDNIRIVNNNISETMIGIYVYPGSTNCKIINNKGNDNTWDYYSYESDTKDHANKFE